MRWPAPLTFGDHAFAQFLSRGEEDRPVLQDFGLVAELYVGVGLELPGFGVAGVGEDQVMQDLHGPPVFTTGSAKSFVIGFYSGR